MNRLIVLIITALSSCAVLAAPIGAIEHGHLILTLASFFGIGILLAFTPCVLPMVPILSTVLMGEENISTKRSFQLSLTFVLSMAMTYALAGMAAGYLGRTVQTILQQPWLIISFSLIFVVMALSMFGLFNLSLPRSLLNYLHQRSHQQQRGKFTGVAIMGFLSTLIASPCVTAPLISVLMYISQTGSSLLGGLILFVMALGMGLPLLLFGIGQGYLLPKAGIWMTKVKFLFGILMLGLSVWMISRLLSDTMISVIWGVFFLMSAVLIIAMDRRSERRFPVIIYGITLLAALYGIFLAYTGINLRADNVAPVETVSSNRPLTSSSAIKNLFTFVQTNQQMDEALLNAKRAHKPVLIEFFAAWCPDCRRVDKEVFADPVVQQRLNPFVTIRVDVTTENDGLIALKKRYQIYAIPTMVFYDKQGRQLKDNEFIEEVGKEGFIKQLIALAS